MWCAEIKRNDDLYSVMETDDLKWLVKASVSEARSLGLASGEQIWIEISVDYGYRRYLINVDKNFVCYSCADSNYTLLNIRKGSIFDV